MYIYIYIYNYFYIYISYVHIYRFLIHTYMFLYMYTSVFKRLSHVRIHELGVPMVLHHFAWGPKGHKTCCLVKASGSIGSALGI